MSISKGAEPIGDATSAGRIFHRVAIIHPSVPRYSVPFFKRLIGAADAEGIEVDVYAGETPSVIRARGDSGDADFVRALRTREWTVRGRAFFYKATSPVRRGEYDLVILEHAVRNFEAYELLARMGGRRIAFWGHGLTYTKGVSRPQEALKYWLTRRAAWFFGYTQRGVDAVVKHGFPRHRTTVFNNTIDTGALRADLASISDVELAAFSREHGLRGMTALYLGGLDTYKRIPFLLESAAIAHQKCADFRILIAGNGSDRPIVEAFIQKYPWAIYLGALHGRDKARALAAAQVISIPGAIGLVALDSLVAGVPIVTTDFPYHGPEYDYLEHGATAIVTRDNEVSYASDLVTTLADSQLRQTLSGQCRMKAHEYTLDHMVRSVLAGIKGALELREH